VSSSEKIIEEKSVLEFFNQIFLIVVFDIKSVIFMIVPLDIDAAYVP
jgi:hypothetical protein